MKLKDFLEVCNMFIHIKIESSDGEVLVDDINDIDDYFACYKYRQLDDRIVNYIDAYESDVSDVPTLSISIR